MDELTQMGQSDAEAKRMCTVPDAEDVDKAVDAALKSCLKVPAELPAGDVRDQAKQGCRDSAD